MKHLSRYISNLKNPEIGETVELVSNEVFEKHLKDFDYASHINGLLLGEVQSGKTGQMFGVIARAADAGFEIFMVITTDNNRLQEQTFTRTLDSFPDFCVCTETDTIRFTTNKMRSPVVLVLKKNVNILKKWRNYLDSSKYLEGRGIFIIDDEADAASLNTKINQDEISAINTHISTIRGLASSCIYMQVTATPQAIILQSLTSGYRPSFVTYFRPGKSYLGGDFFFSKPSSYTIRYTDSTENQSLSDENEEIPSGLASAILSFLISCAQMKLTGAASVCNFLVHPSVRIADHQIIALKIGEFLNDILYNFDDDVQTNSIKSEYEDLYKSKPELKSFELIIDKIRDFLFNSEIKVTTLNSKSEGEVSFEVGFNIIVGGNTLGRGVTFPMLQTVYYSRTSKVPQADTFWQHCRMFGYDRDRGLIRVFMPRLLHKLFQDLNNSQAALVKQILTLGMDETHLYHIDGVKPTRKNVIDAEKLKIINGGINYFPEYPINKNYKTIDSILEKFTNGNISVVEIEFIEKLLSEIKSEVDDDWNSQSFTNAIKVFSSANNINDARLIVRRERRLSRNTGTMLSENERKIVDSMPDSIVLVLYRLTGEKELGWNGHPLWMPNIKLPEGNTFYKISD